jgi:predicted ATPase/DNA-binding SARP family transcriptional activator
MGQIPGLRLFGPIQVERDGLALPNPGSRKALALLGYLAVLAQPCDRATLAALFWEELPESRGRANLSWVLNKLSALLPGTLQADHSTIQFRREHCWLDLAAFDQLSTQDELAALTTAAALYRGELMAGMQLQGCLAFEQWLTIEREHWHQRLLQVLQRIIRCHERQGNHEEGLRFLSRLLALEPWQEEAHQQRMRLLALSGQQTAALAQYETCRRILADEFGVEPTDQTRLLYEQIKAGTLAPPPRHPEAMPPTPNQGLPQPNRPPLPTPLTPFVGREVEQNTITAQLGRPEVRLLTIVGMGGIGKTRLALQCATLLAPHFRDGAVLVSLAPIMGADFLVTAIATELGLIFHEPANAQTHLLSYLRDKELLLVLDNFEHMLAAAGVVPWLLQQAPGVKVLLTSQERLNFQEEWVVELHGLLIPRSAADPRLAQSSAVALFLERARRARADFALSDANGPFVVQICQLTAGLPLGIVLAAAWVRVLSCQEIAAEIAGNLDFLTGAPHTLSDRHRSLRAVFDYAWGRLSEPERAIFARLSVFRGGMRRTAAQAVTGASVALLASLVDKSLLQRTTTGRYEIHEVLRRYAGEQLTLTPERHTAAQDQHARYYTAFLHARIADLRGPNQGTAATEISEEIDNIRAAWRWAVTRQQPTLIEQAADSLLLFYDIRGWYQEGSETFGLAVAALSQPATPEHHLEAVLGQVLARQAVCTYHGGRYDAARPLLERALAIARQHGTSREVGFCLVHLGYILRERGNPEQAEQLVQQGLAAARTAALPWDVAMALFYLGVIKRDLRQYEAAGRYAQECLDLCTPLGYIQGLTFATGLLGFIALDLGHYTEAQSLFREVLALGQAHNYPVGTAIGWHYLGSATYFQGAYTEAHQLLHMALTHSSEVGYQRGAIRALTRLGDAVLALGVPQEACHHYSTALARSSEIGYQRGAIRALTRLGDVECTLGNPHKARQHYTSALAHAHANQNRAWTIQALVGLAAVTAQEHQPAQALELLTIALAHLDSAASNKIRDKAQRLLADLTPDLPPQTPITIQQQSPLRPLETVVQALLQGGSERAADSAGVAPTKVEPPHPANSPVQAGE